MLKKLQLMTGEMLKWVAACDRMTRLDGAQQATIASFQSKVEHYEGLEDTGGSTDRADSSGIGGGEGSLRAPESYCKRME